MKVVVSDTNGEAINFIDEANGKSKSLGTDLITIFNLLAGEKNLNINVNTLTTEAANKVLTVSNDLTKVTNADISKANLEIATKYGLIDKSSQAAINPDLLITSKPGLIIDLTGAINQGFNAYGLALAVKSVLDDNPSMTIKDACKSLAENPLYTKSFGGPTDWASAVYKFGASFLDNVLPTGSSTITVANDQPISQTTTITQGQVLRATSSITDIDGIPTSGVGVLSYKWQSSSVSGGGWSDIAGATASTFITTQAQVGKLIRVVATYTDNFLLPPPPSLISMAFQPVVWVHSLSNGKPLQIKPIGQIQILLAQQQLRSPPHKRKLVNIFAQLQLIQTTSELQK